MFGTGMEQVFGIGLLAEAKQVAEIHPARVDLCCSHMKIPLNSSRALASKYIHQREAGHLATRPADKCTI